MKVVIPLAGKGTRLLPVTKHVPKPLIKVAGRPVMDYVMDTVDSLDVEELIIITGHLKDHVEEYVRSHYRQPARFIEQQVQDGTAGAVGLAEPFVDGPVLIIFVDTLFDADLTQIARTDADGIIWAKEVEDYQRFGVIVTDSDGYMERIVEKPSEPISRLANIGLYYMRDWKTLFEGIAWTKSRPKVLNEYFLTDAFQFMIDRGKRILTAEVGGWYDCGKVDTLLDTNLHLLRDGGRSSRPAPRKGIEIVEPVYVAGGVELEACTIGPNVSLDAGTVVKDSGLEHTIVGAGARIDRSNLRYTLVGADARISGQDLERMVVAKDEQAPAR